MNNSTNTHVQVVELTKRARTLTVGWDAGSDVFKDASRILARRTSKSVSHDMNFSSKEFDASIFSFTRHSLVVSAALSALEWNLGCSLPLTEEVATVVGSLRRATYTQGAVVNRLHLKAAEQQVFQTALEGLGTSKIQAATLASEYVKSQGQGGSWGGSVAEILFGHDVFSKAKMVHVSMQEPGDPDVLMSSRVAPSAPLQVSTPAVSLTQKQMLAVVMFGLDGPDLGDLCRVLQAGLGQLHELLQG